MALVQAYDPVIPNVTDPSRGRQDVPALFAALDTKDEADSKNRPLQAKALAKVAMGRFEAAQWLYEEAVTCTAFYYGAHYGYWSSEEDRYIGYPVQRKSDHVRLTVNLIKPVSDTATGILTQEEPIFRPRSATSEGEDSAAQQASEMYINHLWRRHKLRRLYRLSGRRVFVSGTYLMHVCWDPNEGPLASPSENTLVEGKDGPYSQSMKAGDLRYTALSEDQVAFDPAANDPLDGIDVTIRERYTRAAFDDRFGEERREEAEEGVTELDHMFETREAARSSPLGGRLGSAAVSEDATDEGPITVYTTYVRSCMKYPRGVMVVYTDRQILDRRDNPRYPMEGEPDALWPDHPWPLFVAIGDQREQSPWGRGRVVDMIGSQRGFNGTISKKLQHIAKVGNAKVMLPQNANLEWTDEIGQVLRLGRQHNTSQYGYLSPAQLGPEFGAALDRLQTYMEYMAGTNSSTMGFSGSEVNSGRQENIRIQRDYGRLGPVKRELDEMWGEAMAYSLQLFRRHATDERKIIVAGKNNETSVLFFDRAQLASDVDLVVENNQSLPRDPTERHTVLSTMFQTMGTLPPEMQGMYLELTRLADVQPFLERMNPDQVKARRMSQRFLLGLPTPVFEGDDPLVFKAELERLIKSEEYERRVERERGLSGMSPLEQMAKSAWLFYTMASAGPMAPGMGGAPAGALPAPADEGANGEPAMDAPAPEQEMMAA